MNFFSIEEMIAYLVGTIKEGDSYCLNLAEPDTNIRLCVEGREDEVFEKDTGVCIAFLGLKSLSQGRQCPSKPSLMKECPYFRSGKLANDSLLTPAK